MKNNQNSIINRIKFWFFIGFRYLKAKNNKGKINLIFLSILSGIAGGMMVLIVVLGVMNGFQENHISRRIEIGSYHIAIFKKDYKKIGLVESTEIKQKLYQNIKEIEAIIPYSDRDVILRSKKGFYNDEQVLKLRAVDPNEITKDSKFVKYFQLYQGELVLKNNTIILGVEMFNHILSDIGEVVFLTSDISLKYYNTSGTPFKITDAFKTNNYDYDRYWGFTSIYSLISLIGKVEIDGIGIKLKDRDKQQIVLKKIKNYIDDDYILQTAEKINSGYFTALRLEKIMIILLFILIFLMVAANTFGALKLTIVEKKVDISILKAIGAMPEDIEVIYIIESLILGFAGCILGVTLGVLVVYNIANIFDFFEFIINSILNYIEFLMNNIIPGIKFQKVKIYDNSIYYQGGFPVKLYLKEILLICFSVIYMTILAAYIPVLNASKQKPNQILKS